MNMKKFVNGKYVEMTPEEIEQMQAEAKRFELMEKSRPLTEPEVSRMLITQQINTLTVDDNTALRMKQFYPTFENIIGQKVNQGYKFTYDNELWSVVQPELIIQAHYPPSIGTESLYTKVNETHAGTLDDPIPYSGNMALSEGLYYMQDYVIYLCIRDTVNPVYAPLAELVSVYVDKI